MTINGSKLYNQITQAIEAQQQAPTTPATAPVITGRIQALEAVLEALAGDTFHLEVLAQAGSGSGYQVTPQGLELYHLVTCASLECG